METKEKEYVKVPVEWLEGLVKRAEDFQSAMSYYTYGNIDNDKAIHEAVGLTGYAKSAEAILKYNERI